MVRGQYAYGEQVGKHGSQSVVIAFAITLSLKIPKLRQKKLLAKLARSISGVSQLQSLINNELLFLVNCVSDGNLLS